MNDEIQQRHYSGGASRRQLYPNVKGAAPLDDPENFEYCAGHSILPCVCVKDDLEAYRKYIGLGFRMFTSNDIYEADRILRELKVR